jgi:hypothetical protein
MALLQGIIQGNLRYLIVGVAASSDSKLKIFFE